MKLILTHKKAVEVRDELLWEKLNETTILSAVNAYLLSISNEITRYGYRCHFRDFFKHGFLNPTQSLQFLSLGNVDSIGDEIRLRVNGCEGTKQTKVASYIGFTAYLERKTQGMIRKMKPSKAVGNETFKKIRSKAVTEALTEVQCKQFIECVSSKSVRMGLIAKMLLQGAKRLSEVLDGEIENINWENNTILFAQKKSKVGDACTVITFPRNYMMDLKEHIGERDSGLIFPTRRGKRVANGHIYIFFVGVSVEFKLPIKVTPHVLRASAITILRQKGVASDDIMKVSGHASPSQVTYYDKRDREENVSKEYSLI